MNQIASLDSRDLAKELADKANASLREVYEELLGRWKTLYAEQLGLNRRLSIPCFLDVRPQYFTSMNRIVFVGQETHGWWTEWNGCVAELTVSDITSFYRQIRPKLMHSYRSPYWQAIRYLASQLGILEPEASIVFTNVFPCDVDKKQAPLELHDTFRSWRVLPSELEILRPDQVIFLCGRNYARNLPTFFGSPLRESLSKTNPILAYSPENASWNGIVTLHPNYLRRAGLWQTLDKVVRLTSKTH
jgi:hypothetical protein